MIYGDEDQINPSIGGANCLLICMWRRLTGPDDYNRVVLDLQDGIPDSDYINASYIDVLSITLAFQIASRNEAACPTPSAVRVQPFQFK